MVDKPKLDQVLSNCREYVRSLARLRDVPRDAFLSDPDRVASAKYFFVIAIEACLDAANHIVSSECFRLPSDHADSFRVLAENGVVGEELLPALMAMARFRNRLVHVYWQVDDSLVREYLETRLGDFEAYVAQVARFSRSKPAE
ncbi:MAG: hypothetical protein BWZ02_00986 [Lentisphaerae bacterium ADurb.BinA184]|nr:MAG: hypothetical protein BWZ02_00986 [Lentisphaerae bacterium ADurb.BinA184]